MSILDTLPDLSVLPLEVQPLDLENIKIEPVRLELLPLDATLVPLDLDMAGVS